MKKLVLTIGLFAALFANAETPYLAENLAVWLRADLGLTTNAVGGVVTWANQGTKGSAADVSPNADNSAGHVAYEGSGIGGQPTLTFDGGVYLKTSSAIDLGGDSGDGYAWFIVLKTPCTRSERVNMGLIGMVTGNNNNNRFGAFFPSAGNEDEVFRTYFNQNASGINVQCDLDFESNKVQIVSAMRWSDEGVTRSYSMNMWNCSPKVTGSQGPASAVFTVGTFIQGWRIFKGEIAEVRVYNRPLTWRERSRIQFELCSRYGERWLAHGGINDNALSWYEESDQLGSVSDQGASDEHLAYRVASGGATLELDTPSSVNGYNGYFSNNGGDERARVWYVSTFSAVRAASGVTFTFDKAKVRVGSNPSLYYTSAYGGAWAKLDATVAEDDDSVALSIPAGWRNGFYCVRGDLDGSLAMWHRADMGLTTNAVGGVMAWANCGMYGSVLDMVPKSDNSAAHIAYSANGMGGQPSISFDGASGAYLWSRSSGDMAITSAGAAWFVVCKTDIDYDHRGNQVVFGCSDGSSTRFGGFFSNNPDASRGKLRGYIFGEQRDAPQLEDGKPQVFAMVHWTSGGTPYCGIMNGSTVGDNRASGAPSVLSQKIYIGGSMGLTWGGVFVGDIAEIRVYNRALTARECSEVQFELCSRYGVSWSGHGGIDDEALGWCANSAQFGYKPSFGLPESVVTTATAGGATLTLDTAPASSVDSSGYLTHNASNSFDRVWYMSAVDAARQQPMTFSVNAADFDNKSFLGLYRAASPDGPWVRVGRCREAVDGHCDFHFASNAWQGGYYRIVELGLTGLKIIFR